MIERVKAATIHARVHLAIALVILCALAFDGCGGGDGGSSDVDASVPALGEATADNGAVSFDIDQWWSADDPGEQVLVAGQTMDQPERLEVIKDGGVLRFVLGDLTGVESGIGVAIATWEPGSAHMITATWGNGVTELYVDGTLVGQGTYDDLPGVSPGTPLDIGSGSFGDPTIPSVGNIRTFDRPLTPEEIALLTPDQPVRSTADGILIRE